MNRASALLAKCLPAVAAGAGAAAIGFWLALGPGQAATLRPPRADGGPGPGVPASQSATAPLATPTTLPAEAIGGARVAGEAKPTGPAGSWPQFRGPDRNGISPEKTPLARSWGPNGPPVLWKRPHLGQGHAGPAVRHGRIYLLDHDEAAGRDVLRCISPADGKDIWRYSYPVKLRYDHGTSRTVPAVGDRHVVTLGPKGHVLCLDAKSGRFRWAMDLARQFAAQIPKWYAAQCPLIDNGRAILAPAGPGALAVAVDCDSGKIVWTTPNPMGWKMTHSSAAVLEFGGRRMVVTCGSGGVAGIALDDGTLLWRTTEWKIRVATVPAPVPLPGGRILFTGGYNAGALMLQLKEEDGRIVPTVLFRREYKVFEAEQHTPIFHRGFLYAVRRDGQLACLDLEGNLRWASGNVNRFDGGKGPYLLADGMLYVLDESGGLSLVEATPDAFRRLARARVIPKARHSWAPMALAGGRLLLRDLTDLVCLDVRAPRRSP